MQLLYLLEQEEQRVGSEAITQSLLNGNTVTNGNFTLFVISNHKKQIIKNKKMEEAGWAALMIKWRKKKQQNEA